MKKVSEVKKELEALGCHEKQATDLLIACGVLEDNRIEIKPLQVWVDKTNDKRFHVISHVTNNMVYMFTFNENRCSQSNSQEVKFFYGAKKLLHRKHIDK